MTEEIEYYSKGNIRITNTKAVFGKKVYSMADITSVAMKEKPIKKGLGIFFLVIGLMCPIGLMGLTSVAEKEEIIFS